MRVLAITGPRARAAHLRPFQVTNVEFNLLELPEPRAAAAMVSRTSPDVILVFGGDGTLNRHLEWLMQAAAPLLLVPVGSGNDFAACHGITSLQKAAEVFARFTAGHRVNTSRSDLGRAEFADGSIRYFSCCLNVGLDADAARRANLLPDWLKERNGYFLGGLGALLFYQPALLRISDTENRSELQTPAWLVTVSNTPVFGGGLRIAPQAKIDDGALDVTLASTTELSRLALMWNYPKILSGRHVGMKELQIFTARYLRIDSPVPVPAYGDGERLGELPVQVMVLPQAISVLRAD